MLSNDCKDCFTRIEFAQNTLHNDFEDISKVLADREKIKMFTVDDYMFEFVEYVTEKPLDGYESNAESYTSHWVIGRYITPIPHLIYMSEDEIWFKVTERSIEKFTFFSDDEFIITMHGMLFIGGEFKENLIYRFSLAEIRNLTNDLCTYIVRTYSECDKMINIWNAFKCIGLHDHTKGNTND